MRVDCPLLDEDAEITNTHKVKVSAEKCLLGLMELAAQRRLRVVYFVNNHGSDYGGH